MRGTRLAIAFVGALFISIAAHAQVAAATKEPLPAMKELRGQFDQQKYQDVLKQIQRVLQLKGDAAKPYNRYELLCLRGECFLRIKSMPLAAEAFDDAAEAAKDDSKREGLARGTAVLIRRSKPVGYTPRPARPEKGKPAPPPPKAMAIVAKADREAAMKRLLSDERAAVEPKMQAAQKATSLPPIVEVGRMLSDLRAVEMAATGSGDQTQAMTREIGERSHELIATALDSMNERLESAWSHASTETWIHYEDTGRRQFVGHVGLHGSGRESVVFAVQNTPKIAPVAADLWKVTGNDALKRDAEIAQKLYERAAYILDFKYSSKKLPGREPPRAPPAR